MEKQYDITIFTSPYDGTNEHVNLGMVQGQYSVYSENMTNTEINQDYALKDLIKKLEN